MSHRILIADDHPLMRTALTQTIGQAMAGAEILEVSRFDQIKPMLESGEAADIILLDLHMPGMSGLIGLMMLRAEHPAIPVIVVSASEDPVTVQRAIDYGASGFVPKSAPNTQIIEAIHAVLDGELWLPEIRGLEADAPDPAQRAATLTPQQLRVLAGIAEGKLNKQIAYEMNVAETTVKAHVTTILRKLGVLTRTQAAVLASQLALAPAPPPPVE
ncbi:response regulator [Azospirillum doebereinerae]|uniref:Response regulator transcription factor n=1 Tax=Azospirillum doebereinerae TaxID=92933 RepID=A0A3S0V0U5_9PROT|nr:response regulator transcription factor [Azospirillum doebereinerae]MCG5241202.1 response regulator transcription factor [Azospirillum doebereinerae]RUQ69787.1 response regulator transcription factor [Azospirillum doebereinerae]